MRWDEAVVTSSSNKKVARASCPCPAKVRNPNAEPLKYKSPASRCRIHTIGNKRFYVEAADRRAGVSGDFTGFSKGGGPPSHPAHADRRTGLASKNRARRADDFASCAGDRQQRRGNRPAKP